MLEEYLCCFTSHEHSPVIEHAVSRMDVTVDEYVYAPTRVNAAYRLGLEGSIQFTRKHVKPCHITKIFGVCQYDDSGLDTGTVYMGAQAATFKAKMYDKRQQVLVTKGQIIPDTTRHEATVTRALGISLHDVARPTAVFYHSYPSVLLSKPAAVPGYAPSGYGYAIERNARLPAMALKDRVKSSLEVGALLRLAASSGEHGVDYLCALIGRRYASGEY
jgi:hypothetical protein